MVQCLHRSVELWTMRNNNFFNFFSPTNRIFWSFFLTLCNWRHTLSTSTLQPAWSKYCSLIPFLGIPETSAPTIFYKSNKYCYHRFGIHFDKTVNFNKITYSSEKRKRNVQLTYLPRKIVNAHHMIENIWHSQLIIADNLHRNDESVVFQIRTTAGFQTDWKTRYSSVILRVSVGFLHRSRCWRNFRKKTREINFYRMAKLSKKRLSGISKRLKPISDFVSCTERCGFR